MLRKRMLLLTVALLKMSISTSDTMEINPVTDSLDIGSIFSNLEPASENNDIHPFYSNTKHFYENLDAQTKRLDESVLHGFNIINEQILSSNNNNFSNESQSGIETINFDHGTTTSSNSNEDLLGLGEMLLDTEIADLLNTSPSLDVDSSKMSNENLPDLREMLFDTEIDDLLNTSPSSGDALESFNEILPNQFYDDSNPNTEVLYLQRQNEIQTGFINEPIEIQPTQDIPSTSGLQSDQSRKRKLEKESSDEIDSSRLPKKTNKNDKSLKSHWNSLIKNIKPCVELEFIDKFFNVKENPLH